MEEFGTTPDAIPEKGVGTHIFSKEESVICHYKDGELTAITHFNGHTQLYPVKEAMGRKEMLDFYETQSN